MPDDKIDSCNRCVAYLPEDYDGDGDGRASLKHLSPMCSRTGRTFPDSHRGELPEWCPLKEEGSA